MSDENRPQMRHDVFSRGSCRLATGRSNRDAVVQLPEKTKRRLDHECASNQHGQWSAHQGTNDLFTAVSFTATLIIQNRYLLREAVSMQDHHRHDAATIKRLRFQFLELIA